MNIDELTTELGKLTELRFVDDVGAFSAHNRRRNVTSYLRPVHDDVVLYTSLRNATSEHDAHRLARHLLDFTTENWTASSQPLAKLTNYPFGPAWADSVVVFAPVVAEVIVGQAYFLVPRTYACYPSNRCEAAGNETQAEATVRKGNLGFNDLSRAIDPVIFCRFQLSDGSKSAKHFAVAKAAELASVVERADIKGGTIEIENFERVPCRMVASGEERGLEVVAANAKFHASAADTIAFLRHFTTHGAGEAVVPTSP